jgi:hypothetical protein
MRKRLAISPTNEKRLAIELTNVDHWTTRKTNVWKSPTTYIK